MSWEMDVPPNDLDRAQWRAEVLQGMETPRVVALIAAWCLAGGAALGIVGLMIPPAALITPVALVGAWVLSLVALAQTRSWMTLVGPSLTADVPGRSMSRLFGDIVMTLGSATALAPLATASEVMSSFPGIPAAERRSLVARRRALRIGSWVAFIVGVLFVVSVVLALAWVYQQSQLPQSGPDAWYVLAPIVIGLLGGWLLMAVNGVTALICFGIGGPTRSEPLRYD